MPNGITPEEERRRQEQERRYKKAEEGARAAWQRGLENERDATEALKEEKKTHTGKRRVSFDSSRNQTHLLYSHPPTTDSTSSESTDVGEPSHEALQESVTEGYELIIKEIASLRAELAEEEAVARKRQEHEAARIKYEAAWKEQEYHRQKAEEEALKRGLENEGQFTSQSDSQKPEQGSYAPKPSAQQHPPVRQYSSTSSSYLKHHSQWHHPHPDQTPSASPVPVGFSGLPAESLCSDVAPPHHTPSVSSLPVGLSGLPAISLSSDAALEVTKYRDEGRGRSGHADAYASKE